MKLLSLSNSRSLCLCNSLISLWKIVGLEYLFAEA